MTGRGLVEASTAAEAAAAWWAQQVGAPTFDAIGSTGTPRERFEMGFAGTLASELADRHPVSAEQGQRFADLLAERIAAQLEMLEYVTLATDYGPGPELAEPAEAAGISLGRFPWKTVMGVRPDHVTAALGYGTRSELVWHAPDWQRPACGTQRYDETPDGYESRDELCGLLRYHAGEHGEWKPDTRRCEGCSLSYSQHYERQQRSGYTHSWHPGGAS